jgi:hypothetical protein
MKKLQKILSAAIIFASVTSIYAEEPSLRKKIAVIPNRDNPQIVSVLEGALGQSPRFDFFDRRLVPALLKEWEKRQAGLTAKDNTQELYIMNVDYLVTVENVDTHTFQVTYSSSKKVDWQTNLKARVKAVYLKEGGRVNYYNIEASAKADTQYESPKKAVNESKEAIEAAVKKLFPIEAPVMKSGSGKITLGIGSASGVVTGQRYIIKERTGAGAPADKGFFMIDDVHSDHSTGYLISGGDFNEKISAAVEKQYSDWNLELYGGMASYRTGSDDISHDLGDFNIYYGFRFLKGNNFQLGWGFNMDLPGPGKINRISLTDLLVRYNFHIIKRLYLYVEGGIGIESAYTRESLRSEKDFPEYAQTGTDSDGNYIYEKTRLMSSYAVSANAGAGLKFITGYSTYIFAGLNYTAASDFKSWHLWELYLFETDPEATDLMDAGIDKYDTYIRKHSAAGPRALFGVGYYF